ncbi:MAG: YdeI/OmpD-associated family protein [Planctomycetes bacterium]|nr:YdeI/OmpD-associated family protein [Planctomycetota bacterium]
MPSDSSKVDAYIAKAAPFAQPILKRVRAAVHKGCPGIEERLKWGVPSFEKNGMVCGMAAFKAHATFGFWREKQMKDPAGILGRHDGMMGSRYTDVKELPSDAVIAAYVKEAVALNEAGTKSPISRPKTKKPEAKVPPDLAAALMKNAKARSAFEGFPPSHRREYVEWITEAKREETRTRRVAQAIAMMAEGKSRNWKYANC